MKCIFVSFFNSNNLGDLLLSNELYNEISKEYEVEKVSYYEHLKSDQNISSKVSVANRNKKGKFFDLIKRIKLSFLIKIYNKISKKKLVNSIYQEKLIQSDLLIIGGGNMLFDKDPISNSAKRFDEYVSIAKKNNKKTFAISLGIGPFYNITQEINAVKALSKCDFITFRDIKSYNIYKKHSANLENAYVSIDPVFNFKTKKKSYMSIERPVIGLNLMDFRLSGLDNKSYNLIMDSYRTLIEKLLIKVDCDVIIYSTDINDYNTIFEFSDKIDKSERVKTMKIDNVEELMEFYNTLTIIIGSRMHAMIFAFVNQIPFVGVSWQQKVDAFFEIIDSGNDKYDYLKLEENLDDLIEAIIFKLENYIEEVDRMKMIHENILKFRDIDTVILESLKE